MASSISNLVYNPSEEIHKIKCKDCTWFLEYKSVSDNLVKNNFLMKNLKNHLNNDINNCFCCWEKVFVYPDEYMDEWDKFNETTLSENNIFYSNLNMNDYNYGERVLKILK